MSLSKHENFIKEANILYHNKYRYIGIYIKSTELIEMECLRHGIFNQSPINHLSGQEGCRSCHLESRTKSQEQTIKEFKAIHGDKYDYSLVAYVKCMNKVKIICNTCKNIFEQSPNKHKMGRGCVFCSKGILPGNKSLTRQQFIHKSQIVHEPNRYDYTLVEYVRNSKDVKIICNICNIIFKQNPGLHMQGSGCRKCFEREWGLKQARTQKQFEEEAIKIHGPKRFDYSVSKYINANEYVDIKCNICLIIFRQVARKHLMGRNGCKNCKFISKGEERIKLLLTSLNIKFDPQFRIKIIANKKYDFYFEINGRKFILEYDGIQHFRLVDFFEVKLDEQHIIDIQKTYIALRSGYTVLRISYNRLNELERIVKIALNIPEDRLLYLSDPEMYDWLLEGLKHLDNECAKVTGKGNNFII